MEAAKALNEAVYGYYRDSSDIQWEERRTVEEAYNEAEAAFNRANYVEARAKAAKVFELAQPIVARVEGQRRSRQVVADLVATEYALCPVCGNELDPYGRAHYCSWEHQEGLRARGQFQGFVLKVSYLGEVELVKLEALYSERHSEYELRLTVNNNVVVDDGQAVVTKTFWKIPTARERELVNQLTEVDRQIQQILSAQAEYDDQLRRAKEELDNRRAEAKEGRHQQLGQYFVVGMVRFQQAEFKGRVQLQCGLRMAVQCDVCGKVHERNIRLVANPNLEQPPVGVPVIGRLGSRSLYSHCDSAAWMFNPILPPVDRTAELAELQARRDTISTQLDSNEVAVENETGGSTAMAAAFQAGR